jgi:hypothetical protein
MDLMNVSIRRNHFAVRLVIAGCVALLAGCGDSPASSPEPEAAREDDIPAEWTATASPSIDLTGVSHATLRAWEDTRVGLPPLSIASPDSLATLNGLLFAPSARWYETNGVLPGIPLPVEYYKGSALSARSAMVEIAHDQGGYFLVWRGAQQVARKADAAEIAAFLGMFGISVEYR